MTDSDAAAPGIRHTRPTDSRLRTTREFQHCYNSGFRAGDAHLLVFAADRRLNKPRAGVSVSKKHGNAVCRNRKKRLLREAFRLSRHGLPPHDYVLVPRQSDVSTVDDYQTSFLTLARRLSRRIRADAHTQKSAE